MKRKNAKIRLLITVAIVSFLTLSSFTGEDESGGKSGYYCDQSTPTACTLESSGGYTVYSTGIWKKFL